MKIFTHASHLRHTTGDYIFPLDNAPVNELPVRIDRILEGVRRTGNHELANVADLGCAAIEAIHEKSYLDFLKTAFLREVAVHRTRNAVHVEFCSPRIIRHPSDHFSMQKSRFITDTFSLIYAGTFDAAYWSAQCAINACEDVLAGSRVAFALGRPPGHHAYVNQGGGFCYLNNAAIAARHIQTRIPSARVAILDIDFHHGNGTQEIFYDDPTVLFCSLHGDPTFAYPFISGARTETGNGDAEGTNINIPLAVDCTDHAYLNALHEALKSIQNFAPQYVVLSLGFDIALGDPYGGFKITPGGFHQIGRAIESINLPIIIVQEGGYLIETLTPNADCFFSGLFHRQS